MPKYLIDVNLPPTINVWKGNDFLHVSKLGLTLPDNYLWEYAKENGFTIVTKDTDFEIKILSSRNAPKVILFKTGNLRFKELVVFLKMNWESITEYSKDYKLVRVFKEYLQGVN